MSLGIPPGERESSIMWYHGTDARAAKQILRDGFLRPVSKKRYRKEDADLLPLPGRVYLSWKPAYAFMIGTIYASRAVLGASRGIVFVFEVDGPDLVDVEPDEDAVGWLALSGKIPELTLIAEQAGWLSRKSQSGGPDKSGIGKCLLAVLDSVQIRTILDHPDIANIAHLGPVPIVGAWRVTMPGGDEQYRLFKNATMSGGLRNLLNWAQEVWIKRAVRVWRRYPV